MAASPPPVPAVLMDELVEECLLRVPPEEPGDLARAALVSRQWHRVATGAVFRHRYIKFHRSAPLLCYIANINGPIQFVSISSTFRPRHARRRLHCHLQAVQSSHGRILLRSNRAWKLDDLYLFVWDPIRHKQWELPVLLSTMLSTTGQYISNWDAAMVCAGGDGCSHLDCHFKVVVVGRCGGRTFSCSYSSEADSWSNRIFVSTHPMLALSNTGSVLVGKSLYFRIGYSYDGAQIFFEYDLTTNQMCTICLHCEGELGMDGVLIATEDGRLGVADTSNSTLCLWLMEQGRLAGSRVIQLHALLPPEALEEKPYVAAFAETGAGVIFLWTRVGYFTVDLRSGRSQKVGNCFGRVDVVPYASFCTPAPGIVSTREGPGSTVVVSTNDEPGIGVVVSTDEGPGDVAVSTDVGPGDVVMSTDEGPVPSMSSA